GNRRRHGHRLRWRLLGRSCSDAEAGALQLSTRLPEPRLQRVDHARGATWLVPDGKACASHLAAALLHVDRVAQPGWLVYLHPLLPLRGSEWFCRPTNRSPCAALLS